MKATAIAHPIQGLIKYHGLKIPRLRIPYHDSISVCIEALKTTTTVEALNVLEKNEILINEKEPVGSEKQRIETVLNELKKTAKFHGSFKITSENNLRRGKGLGFSASGFAALGLAACEALGLKFDTIRLSEIVRLGAGSATRSLVGSFAVWYADSGGRSYAEQLRAPGDVDFSMVIVPIQSSIKTDEAHVEVLSSPLFKARLKNIDALLEKMKTAVKRGDTATIGKLAEEDTLSLHAITMTGKSHMILWEPDTVRIVKEVIRMREEGVPAWYSMDTGPSVFVNTYRKDSGNVALRLRRLGYENVIVSGTGEQATTTENHLF